MKRIHLFHLTIFIAKTRRLRIYSSALFSPPSFYYRWCDLYARLKYRLLPSRFVHLSFFFFFVLLFSNCSFAFFACKRQHWQRLVTYSLKNWLLVQLINANFRENFMPAHTRYTMYICIYIFVQAGPIDRSLGWLRRRTRHRTIIARWSTFE